MHLYCPFLLFAASVGPTGRSNKTTARSPGTTSPPTTKRKKLGALEIVGSCIAAIVLLLVVSFGVYYIGFRKPSDPEVWTELAESPPPGPHEAAAEVAAVTAVAAGPREKAPEVIVEDTTGPTEKVPSEEDADKRTTEHKQEADGVDNVGFSEDSAL